MRVIAFCKVFKPQIKRIIILINGNFLRYVKYLAIFQTTSLLLDRRKTPIGNDAKKIETPAVLRLPNLIFFSQENFEEAEWWKRM